MDSEYMKAISFIFSIFMLIYQLNLKKYAFKLVTYCFRTIQWKRYKSAMLYVKKIKHIWPNYNFKALNINEVPNDIRICVFCNSYFFENEKALRKIFMSKGREIFRYNISQYI